MTNGTLGKFVQDIAQMGMGGACKPEFKLGAERKYELFYVPFENINHDARLVLVGITPGPTQIEMAYDRVQKLLRLGMVHEQILADVKKIAAFGGPRMRPNLVKMLNHFGFGAFLGISDINSLWEENAYLLHATSVIPHAAFSNKKPFCGSFAEIMRSSLLKECFLDSFVESLSQINDEALYVALGPTPRAALEWCVENGHLNRGQVMGEFAHPSAAGGSRVPYYLREKSRASLTLRDPVLGSCEKLDSAYEEMRRSVQMCSSQAG